MAAGDAFITCDNNYLGDEQIFRLMIYDDGDGNPVLHTNTGGTALQPFFSCGKRNNISASIIFSMLIRKSGDNKPYLNTTN